MKIHCKYDELLDPKSLKPHPKNRNKHSTDQIERLGKLYEFHGIRHPIIVSKLFGFIVAGHGRRDTAISKGIKEFPVVYQDFESKDAEYAFLTSDNAIALWAELDITSIQLDLPTLSDDFNTDYLGVQSFLLESSDKFIEKELATDLWNNEFEGPKKDFKIVISLEREDFIKKVLDLLDIKKVRKFNSGSLLSIRWPEIK